MPEALGPCFDPAGHCITCGDLGVEMRVLRVDEGRASRCARTRTACAPRSRSAWWTRRPAPTLLVHAGTAIARLEAPA